MSTSFVSDLAEELYALMEAPRGATIEAIRAKPFLMGLDFVRAKVSVDGDAAIYGDAVASTVQVVLKDASYDLEKPLQKRNLADAGTDMGAAARILLALEQGTDTLSLADRRKKAAKYTGKKIRTMAKTQEGRRGHEYALMEALAEKLVDQETISLPGAEPLPFDASFVDGSVASWTQRPLPDYQRVWNIARLFPDHIAVALDCVKHRTAGWHKGAQCAACLPSLGTYARFVAVTEDIRDPDLWEMFRKEYFPARAVVARIQAAAPFGSSECHLLERSIRSAANYRDLGERLGQNVFGEWDSWLRTCKCPPTKLSTACRVHQTVLAFAEYVVCIESEWEQLRHQLQASTPAEFVEYNERIAFGRVGLSVPG